MELNALTRWESIGKDLYQSGTVGRDIARLKARSRTVEQHRAERQQRRTAVEATIDSEADAATPSASRLRLTDLEKEETQILEKWRALREKGKSLRIEEDRLENEVVQSARDVFPPGHQKWIYLLYRSLRRFGKGFLVGFAGKATFSILGLCLRHKLNFPRLVPSVGALLIKPDLYRYGGFLGSFLMLFESSIRILRMKGWLSRQTLQRHHRSVRVIISAVIAGSAAIAFLPRSVRLGIAMFFTVRALEILVRYMVEEHEKTYGQTAVANDAAAEQEKRGTGVVALAEVRDELVVADASTIAVVDSSSFGGSLKALFVRLSKIPASNHFDTAVMAVASSQVIHAWLFNRPTVEPSYLHFLDFQGGRVPCVQHGYVELHTAAGIAPGNLEMINAMRSAEGRGALDFTRPLTNLMCNVIHRETESCTLASFDYFKAAYLRALPVYLPVYIVPMLLFKHRQLLRSPISVLMPTISNLLRSSLFLSSYCTVSWSVACLSTNLGLAHHIKGALAGFGGGLMVAMEKKGRRVELALYVLSQSLPSTFRTLRQWGMVPAVPHGESLCFIAAMSICMWSYVTRPHLLRSSYLGLFLWFFGSGGRSAGFSSRAVEHSTPKSLKSSLDHMGPPLLSPDPMAPACRDSHTDGATSAAGAVTVACLDAIPSAASAGESLLPRHSHRLSTVEDQESGQEQESDSGNSARRLAHPH